MRIFLFVLMVLGFAGANDDEYANLYLQEGIGAVEKTIESRLQTKAFWQKRIRDQNVTFGYFEQKDFTNFVLVDKSKPSLTLYDNEFNVLLQTEAVVGEIKGDKFVEGDLKTPNGVYQFTKRIEHVDPFYGPLAIVTNYPNYFDRMHQKNGSGIWLHGFPLDNPKKQKTEGCIAVENELLKTIDEMLQYQNAILITGENGGYTTTRDEIAHILAFIYRWKSAWKYNEYDAYLSMYSPENFQWRKGQEFDRFARAKKRIFAIAHDKRIRFSNIKIIPYPTSLYEQKVFQVTMFQKYDASNHRSRGIKTLYVTMDENNRIQIILEK